MKARETTSLTEHIHIRRHFMGDCIEHVVTRAQDRGVQLDSRVCVVPDALRKWAEDDKKTPVRIFEAACAAEGLAWAHAWHAIHRTDESIPQSDEHYALRMAGDRAWAIAWIASAAAAFTYDGVRQAGQQAAKYLAAWESPNSVSHAVRDAVRAANATAASTKEEEWQKRMLEKYIAEYTGKRHSLLYLLQKRTLQLQSPPQVAYWRQEVEEMLYEC